MYMIIFEISRTSHPYYTGKTKLVDTAGRIDKFKNRYAGLSLKNQKSTNENLPISCSETPIIHGRYTNIRKLPLVHFLLEPQLNFRRQALLVQFLELFYQDIYN